MKRLAIDVRPGDYAVVRLPADAAVPAELFEPGEAFVSVTRTPEELSVICPAGREPAGSTAAEDGWRLLSVRGPLEFTLTGIIAALASELAAAGVALFSMSTFDTDHILVRGTDLDHAVKALRESGHEVANP